MSLCTSEQPSEWPSTQRVDFLVFLPKVQPINEALIHLILLAISDILCASRVWLLFGYFFVNCHVTILKFNADILLLVQGYILLLSTSNCWMTFYLAIKRFRMVFDFEHARKQLNRSTTEKIRQGICYGFLFGIVQGEHKRVRIMISCR